MWASRKVVSQRPSAAWRPGGSVVLRSFDFATALHSALLRTPTLLGMGVKGGFYGAEMVWGSVAGSELTAPPKVFKLTGMSAAEVRGLASEVSQEGTGTEERVAMNRSGLS